MADNTSFCEELLIVVDKKDNIIGYANREKCHQGQGILHRAFSIFIFNDQSQLLLQKRSNEKKLWPHFWSNSVCSHPRKGESYEEAAFRRLEEELGFKTELHSLFKLQYKVGYQNIGTENEMCRVFVGKANGVTRPDPNEIADLKYVDLVKLDEDILCQPHLYTPWFRMEWDRIQRNHRTEIDNL